MNYTHFYLKDTLEDMKNLFQFLLEQKRLKFNINNSEGSNF